MLCMCVIMLYDIAQYNYVYVQYVVATASYEGNVMDEMFKVYNKI